MPDKLLDYSDKILRALESPEMKKRLERLNGKKSRRGLRRDS
jgi:hypothetical protein